MIQSMNGLLRKINIFFNFCMFIILSGIVNNIYKSEFIKYIESFLMSSDSKSTIKSNNGIL